MHIEATRGDQLKRERWVIRVDCDTQIKLVLESYHEESRETTRKRKWKPEKAYCRLSYTYRSIPFTAQKLEASEVPLPEDVEAEIKDVLAGMIRELPIKRG